jgi:hypothetical protein
VFNWSLWDLNKTKKAIREGIINEKIKYTDDIDSKTDKIYTEEIRPIVVIFCRNLMDMQFSFDLIPNYLKILYISKRYINNPKLVPVKQ